MKKLMLVMILAAAATFAAAPKADVEKAVLSAEKAWSDAAVKGDTGALDKLLGDDLMYTHSSAKTETKEEVLKAATGMKSVEFTDTKVRQYGNVAVVTHKAVITAKTGTASNLFLTHVWAKQGGGWQLVSRQATRLP